MPSDSEIEGSDNLFIVDDSKLLELQILIYSRQSSNICLLLVSDLMCVCVFFFSSRYSSISS